MPDETKVILLSYMSPINWRLPMSEAGPLLGSVRGYSILNPLCLQQVKCSVSSNWSHATYASFPNEAEVVFNSDELAVVVPGKDREKEGYTASWLGSAFLCWVRILCSQHSIGREPRSSMIVEGKWDRSIPIRLPTIPSKATGTRVAPDGFGWETAITPEVAAQAIQLINLGRLAPSPLHHMISAIDSIMAEDFQSGYVLAATAMESFVSNHLHQTYEAKKMEKENPTMRFLTIPGTKSETVKKDPIWEFLNKGRPDFKLLLHEKPLYLGLPSVLMADQPLYDRARKLYKTRNDLVHEGVWSQDDKTYRPSREDGVEALQTVADVIKFYDGPTMYIPKLDTQFTEFKTATLQLRPRSA